MKYRKAPMFPREGAAAGREFPTMRSSRFNCERAGAHAKNESASAALRKRITGKGKNGAGDRSRTGVASLGSWSITVLLHPHPEDDTEYSANRPDFKQKNHKREYKS